MVVAALCVYLVALESVSSQSVGLLVIWVCLLNELVCGASERRSNYRIHLEAMKRLITIRQAAAATWAAVEKSWKSYS